MFYIKTILMDLFLTKRSFSSQDVNWWTGEVWIIVMFLSAVWTLTLTAPIHCRGAIGEQVMECYIYPVLMTKQTRLHLRESACSFLQLLLTGCVSIFRSTALASASTESLFSVAGFTGPLFFLNILPRKLDTSSPLGFGAFLGGSASVVTGGFCPGVVSICAVPLALLLSTSSFSGGFGSFVTGAGGVSLFCSTASFLLISGPKK